MTPEEISAALEHVLGRPVADLRRLTGGASRETWSFRTGDERFVLQREPAGAGAATGQRSMETEATLLRAAAAAGVPVAEVVASGAGDTPLGTGYLVARFVEGETIARRILRDDDYAHARAALAGQCGTALAAVHAIDPADVPGLERTDEVARYREVLDGFGDPSPTFELAFRWLADNRPPEQGEAVVHGDFRLGNLIVGPAGLRAVVDWELAHLGDPMEDLGWLCVRAWRFGGPQPVAGVGPYEQLFDAYAAASGRSVNPEVARWWEVLGTLKWGIMCIVQARAHLDGWTRSVELAAIGRRVCENEHDLLLLLAPDALRAAAARPPVEETTTPGLHGRPTAAELLEAVAEWVEGDVRSATDGRVAFHSRVAANVLATVRREALLGPAMADAHARRLAVLGVADETALATGIREGRLAGADVERAVAETVLDKLAVANPSYSTK